jgi:H+/Cl- antiporter ClcA
MIDKWLEPAFHRLRDLADHYSKLGYAGFLSVIGALVIIFTVFIAFQTDPANPGKGYLNVDHYEETLFILTGIFLMIFGGVAYGLRMVLEYRVSSLETELQIAKLRTITEVSPPKTVINKG